MKKIITICKFKSMLFFLSVVSISLSYWGCSEDPTPSIYNPNVTGVANPAITELLPANSALAGVSIITINGSNFSPNPGENFVYFGDTAAEVLNQSANQLTVKAPVKIGNDISVYVSVLKAESFSNKIAYSLEAAVAPYGDLKDSEVPWGTTTDPEGNLFVSLVINSVGSGIWKITPDGQKSQWAPKGAETSWSCLKYGPDGALYGARTVKAIFRIVENTAAAVFASSGLGTILDFDFDQSGNIWAGGNNANIYSVSPTKTVTAFPFDGNVKSVRVFNNYLYLSAKRGDDEKIFRFQILSGTQLGPEEEYFNLTPVYGQNIVSALAITFAADGDLLIGLDNNDVILVVHPDKSYEPLYPGLLLPRGFIFAWGVDQNLYMVRGITTLNSQTLFKINMQKTGAPYYGRGN